MRGKNVHIERIKSLRSHFSPLSTYGWICLSLWVKGDKGEDMIADDENFSK